MFVLALSALPVLRSGCYQTRGDSPKKVLPILGAYAPRVPFQGTSVKHYPLTPGGSSRYTQPVREVSGFNTRNLVPAIRVRNKG